MSIIEARAGEIWGVRVDPRRVSLMACLGVAMLLTAATTLVGKGRAATDGAGAADVPRDMASFLQQADPAVLRIAAGRPDVVSVRPPGWERLALERPPTLDLGRTTPIDEAGSPAGPAAAPFVLKGPERAEALQCLTTAIYYEAALEPEAGQAAVAQVVLNRLRHPDYPKSVCGVVFQGADRPGCQFSFACDGSMARAPVAWAWKQSHEVAGRALDGSVQKAVGLATHYHTDWMIAPWTSSVIKVAHIGQHLFFRRPGSAGAPGAFSSNYRGGEAGASRTWLIGRPQPALQSQLLRVSTEGALLAPQAAVRDGRTIALPPSTLFLGKVHGTPGEAGSTIQPIVIPASAMGQGQPPMHAMVAMRAAAARAVRAAEREQAALAATRERESAAEAPAPPVAADAG